MNLQTIRNLEDALTAFGAGNNVTVEMSESMFDELRSLSIKKEETFAGSKHDLVLLTPGGFVITVIEKKRHVSESILTERFGGKYKPDTDMGIEATFPFGDTPVKLLL